MRKRKPQPEVKQARFNVNDLTDYDIDVLLKRIGERLTRPPVTMNPTVITTWPTTSGGVTITHPPINTWSINGHGQTT